jgi:hypothetical protein
MRRAAAGVGAAIVLFAATLLAQNWDPVNAELRRHPRPTPTVAPTPTPTPPLGGDVAFPTIVDADTKTGTVTSNTNVWTITYPTNLVAGDLVVLLVAFDGDPGFSFATYTTSNSLQGEWVTGLAMNGGVLCFIANGTESGTFTMTLAAGASEQGAWRILRITNWYGVMAPGGFNLGNGQVDSDGVAISISANGTTNVPNPPSLDPANWATEDTLWLAAMVADTSRTVSVYPSNFPDRRAALVSGGATGATLGFATLGSASGSIDPGTFTISAADDWAAITVAIRPASAAVVSHLWKKRSQFSPILAQ